ncbi:HAMP domain-containing sensor histidine kinase [Paenibacillus sp. GP183]|uniref:sensor histidine kinase n=1 Tax=Paenibacillus sp. GP183 TaxID=1882751 RepID=UPI00089B8222|nr:HAMP domain-containing sensor histidine kinase [Paenibacillus sp. GP183]SEB60403.1 Signal transduction histidine kinase [Paenibacillus sp. GP183]
MMKKRISDLFQSLYLKIFLSFLATCVLFFVGLGVFWNYYFTDLFYKDKKVLLQSRYTEVTRLLNSFQDGSISTRELRITVRLLARSINGQILLVDSKGAVMNGSSNLEGAALPPFMDSLFVNGVKGKSGFEIAKPEGGANQKNNIFAYYAPSQLSGQPIVVLLQVPAGDISETIAAVRINILVPLLFSLLAVGLILFIISRMLAKPIQQINRAALDLANGDFSTRVPVTTHDEVGQLASSFNFMVDQLEHWEGTRQEFLANVSHELRSPLTTLRGFIIAMNDRVIPEEKYSHYLQLCDFEVQRLQRLVNDLLDLARIENSADSFRLQPVNLLAKLEDVLELLRSPIEQRGLSLQMIVPYPGHVAIWALLDPDRFAQIVQNLVYNAMQFTPAGGEITLAVEANEEEVHLYVRDTGVGMPAEELARIWDRFYKADESRTLRTDGGSGTGLGLTIVKHLISGMNGTIEVQSRVGEGTEFRIVFPRIQP